MSSCNGCRALRKGCSESCILRACLEWIPSPHAQSNATLFVARFFGRSDLMSFISSVSPHQRPALFQSLLYEACGRTVNPVSGAVGLLSSGNWHLCQAAVETVLAGGALHPIPGLVVPPAAPEHSDAASDAFSGAARGFFLFKPSSDANAGWEPHPVNHFAAMPPRFSTKIRGARGTAATDTASFGRDHSATSTTTTTTMAVGNGGQDRSKLLNLFV